METKSCTFCKIDLPITEFYLKSKNGGTRDARCRICRAAEMRAYRKENVETVKAIQKKSRTKHAAKCNARAAKWYQDNKERAKFQMAKRRAGKPDIIKCEKLRASYGITLDDYNAMKRAQNGVCEICGNECKTGKSLAVDHCHRSGKIRGLLCQACNQAIGLLKESTELMVSAINYINKHQ